MPRTKSKTAVPALFTIRTATILALAGVIAAAAGTLTFWTTGSPPATITTVLVVFAAATVQLHDLTE